MFTAPPNEERYLYSNSRQFFVSDRDGGLPTANGTATEPSDYTAVSGTLTFSPGQTTRTIVVPVNGDTEPEATETFFVSLTNATNAAIVDGQGIGTITADDPGGTLQFAAATFTIFENRVAEMVKSFIISPEYRLRFGQ